MKSQLKSNPSVVIGAMLLGRRHGRVRSLGT